VALLGERVVEKKRGFSASNCMDCRRVAGYQRQMNLIKRRLREEQEFRQTQEGNL